MSNLIKDSDRRSKFLNEKVFMKMDTLFVIYIYFFKSTAKTCQLEEKKDICNKCILKRNPNERPKLRNIFQILTKPDWNYKKVVIKNTVIRKLFP